MSDAAELDWYDLEAWGVEGRGWNDVELYYDRLPARAKATVPEVVWNLSRTPTGLSARFETDATAIHARWNVTTTLGDPAWAPLGKSGVDLYAQDGTGRWRWAGAPKVGLVRKEIEDVLLAGIAPGTHRYMLYLPLYNQTLKASIGVPKGSMFRPIAPRQEKPIVFYGTSIQHGAHVSRAGIAHVAILGRRLNRPTINLGFAGNAKMEIAIADLLCELDPALLVIDSLPNMDRALVEERAEPFMRRVCQGFPRLPIVMVEDRPYTNGWIRPGARWQNDTRRPPYRAVFEMLRREGVPNLAYIPGEALFGDDDEGSMDSSHPSDLGAMRMADALEPVLRSLLA